MSAGDPFFWQSRNFHRDRYNRFSRKEAASLNTYSQAVGSVRLLFIAQYDSLNGHIRDRNQVDMPGGEANSDHYICSLPYVVIDSQVESTGAHVVQNCRSLEGLATRVHATDSGVEWCVDSGLLSALHLDLTWVGVHGLSNRLCGEIRSYECCRFLHRDLWLPTAL